LNRLDRFRLLFVFLFVFLLVFLFVRFLIAGFRVSSLSVFFLLFIIFLFVGCFFLVALRFERGSFISFQRDGKNAVGGVIVEALIELADAGIEVACRNEI